MNRLQYRNVAKSTGIRTRYKSLSSIEQVKLRVLKKCAMMLMAKFKREKDVIEKKKVKRKILLCINLSLGIQIDTYVPIDRPVRMIVSLENMTYMFSKEFLRFRKEDITNLYLLLRFPDKVRLENRSTMSGQEVFMRGLYELCTGAKKTIVSEIFGRHPSDQCRAFNYFINHIYNNFHHLVTDNLPWWFQNDLMERSAVAIDEKLGVRYADRFAAFIDCNCLRTDRPGGGPQEDGPGSERWSNDVQRAFYNGWKSIHGLKHQTVDNALGFTIDVFGPVPLRGNDMSLFRDSNINQRMAELGEYKIFGDSAYRGGNHSHCASYGTDAEFNSRMKSVRISIEWNYMTTVSLFAFVGMEHKFKVFESCGVARIYIVATLFKNFHASLYGNQTMNYFGVILPDNFLAAYINGTVL